MKNSLWPWLLGGAILGGLAFCAVAVVVAVLSWNVQAVNNPPPPPLVQIPSPIAEEVDDPATPIFAPTATLFGKNTRPVPTGNAAVVARRLENAPSIDGDLGDWPSEMPTTESNVRVYSVQGWDGTEDVTAVWRVGWDGAHLYTAVQVTDDTHVQTQTGRTIFRGDGLEIQIDTDRNGDGSAASLSPDDYQINLSPGNFADLAPEVYRFRGTAAGRSEDAMPHNIAIAAQPTGDGYTVEVRIPWSDLGVTPSEGLILGLSLNVNDTDTRDAAVQEVMLSNVSTRSFGDPTTWGVLTLAEN